MVHPHILPFLIMSDSPTTSLLGGLVVEDQQNGLLEVLILTVRDFFSVDLEQSGRMKI